MYTRRIASAPLSAGSNFRVRNSTAGVQLKPPPSSRSSFTYEPTSIIGRGAFATVFKGTMPRVGTVAIKRIQLVDVAGNEEFALMSLDHPNIIKLFHVEDRLSEFRFYVLELCSTSMDQLFSPSIGEKKYQGRIPSDQDALLQLSGGLHYIHRAGFIHRDIKPANVLISDKPGFKPTMKWSDFGLSRPVNERGTFTQSGVRGTRDWMPPEMQKMVLNEDSKDYPRGTIASDIFAAGEVFFYFISGGFHPFGTLGGYQIPVNIVEDIRENWNKLRIKWFAGWIVEMMMENDASRRIGLDQVITSMLKNDATPGLEQELVDLCCLPELSDVELSRFSRLLDQGVPTNLITDNGMTPLILLLSCYCGDPSSLLSALKKLMAVNQPFPSVDVHHVDCEGRNARYYLGESYENRSLQGLSVDEYEEIAQLLFP